MTVTMQKIVMTRRRTKIEKIKRTRVAGIWGMMRVLGMRSMRRMRRRMRRMRRMESMVTKVAHHKPCLDRIPEKRTKAGTTRNLLFTIHLYRIVIAKDIRGAVLPQTN